MREIRKADRQDRDHILKGIELLKQARDHFKQARAIKTANKIRIAIKSSGGALRHIDHAIRRADRAFRIEAQAEADQAYEDRKLKRERKGEV